MPQIFVVHGALGSAAQMAPIAGALAALGTVHNVELPGHGRTVLPASSDFSMHTFVRALESKLRGANADITQKPFVFGYSMGGYAALALEAEHPGTFAGILTLGTKFAWTPEVALREAGRLNADVIAEKIPK
ncbi:MAG: alpha/beta fold hydrolase, partial [Gemmatimonadaceae bacterium]